MNPKILGFIPCTPCADTAELAEQSRRLILIFPYNAPNDLSADGRTEARVIIAPQFEMNSGWVIGTEEKI